MSIISNIEDIVEYIFSKPPEQAFTYPIVIMEKFHPDPRVCAFPYLMNILLSGAKKLFGNDITPQTISEDQFKTLQTYMLSMGYRVHYRFKHMEEDNTSSPLVVDIWFEECPKPKRNCHGILTY